LINHRWPIDHRWPINYRWPINRRWPINYRRPGWMLPMATLLGLGAVTVGVFSYLVAFQALPRLPGAEAMYSPQQHLKFDGRRAYQHILAQVALGPRPTGSAAAWAAGDLIVAELEKVGWQSQPQEFLFKGIRGRNIIGRRSGSDGPVIILGAHYDTRPAADHDPVAARRAEWIEGANDGASGVAVLLELARTLQPEELNHDVWLAFFDAEDRGFLEGWPFSVGARHLAGRLTINPEAVIVVDMVGAADARFYFERYSTPALKREIWAVAAGLGYDQYFIPRPKYAIIDDHIPFLERLIPAVDIIDFDYPYWHTLADTANKVTPASLERVGRTLEAWLEAR
jgi:hypothetical protein